MSNAYKLPRDNNYSRDYIGEVGRRRDCDFAVMIYIACVSFLLDLEVLITQ